MILPLDTETTGLPSKQLDLSHPNQPHLVALSALQIENDRIIQSISLRIIPESWSWDDSPESEDRAFQVHRLTMDDCRKGVSEKTALDLCLALWDDSAEIIAHNLDFDRQIIAIAIARHYPDLRGLLDAWLSAPGTCTMLSSKPIVNAQTKPNAKTGKTRLKNPNLGETYQHFFNEPLERRHSANADAVACWEIYRALQEHRE
jgi:DNA polymerase III subunit epsilon